MPGGRPSAYDLQTAEAILVLLAEGQSLSEICRRDDMPARSTVSLWIANNVEGFADKYVGARDAQAEHFADEIIEISDDGRNDWVERNAGDGETGVVVDHEHIARSKLRVDSRKWLMARMAPKRYGDRITAEHTGADGKDLIPEADPSKIALAILSVLRGAKPEGER